MLKGIMLIQVKNDFIQIDDNDYELIKNFKWNILEVTPNNKYATTYIERKLVLMHRLLMGFPKGKEIDHIDGNGLNNSRSNLRICSHKDNLRNRKINKKDKVCSLCHQKITQFDSFRKTQLDDNVCEYQHDVCWWDYVLN